MIELRWLLDPYEANTHADPGWIDAGAQASKLLQFRILDANGEWSEWTNVPVVEMPLGEKLPTTNG